MKHYEDMTPEEQRELQEKVSRAQVYITDAEWADMIDGKVENDLHFDYSQFEEQVKEWKKNQKNKK